MAETPASSDRLDQLGLQRGDAVRFAPSSQGQARLQDGTVKGSNKDGSLTIIDAKGASRAIPPERVWRGSRTPRGRHRWVPLMDGEQQLQLFRP
jgi:hypothetical protein